MIKVEGACDQPWQLTMIIKRDDSINKILFIKKRLGGQMDLDWHWMKSRQQQKLINVSNYNHECYVTGRVLKATRAHKWPLNLNLENQDRQNISYLCKEMGRILCHSWGKMILAWRIRQSKPEGTRKKFSVGTQQSLKLHFYCLSNICN